MRFSLVAILLPVLAMANPLRVEITINGEELGELASTFKPCGDADKAACFQACNPSYFDARSKAQEGDCYVKKACGYYTCRQL